MAKNNEQLAKYKKLKIGLDRLLAQEVLGRNLKQMLNIIQSRLDSNNYDTASLDNLLTELDNLIKSTDTVMDKTKKFLNKKSS